MNLIAQFQTQHWTRIAFAGATKHAGKTTAMNRVIADAANGGIPVGLCSIGLDGERLDTILGVAKPPVSVPVGTVIASAEQALAQSTAQFEYLEDTGISSPLGNILIARASVPGQVLLAGVRQRYHVDAVLPRLEAFGAKLCLVDGAFNRVAAAVPATVDAVVLAVGAVAATTVVGVMEVAYTFLQRFRLPVVPDDLKAIFEDVVATGEIGAWDGHSQVRFEKHQAMLGLGSQSRWTDTISHLWLPGAVSDGVLEGLLGHGAGLTVIMAHPAQLLAGQETMEKWFRRGHQLMVWTPLPVACIAINPHSITGYDLSDTELRAAVEQVMPGVPVYNVVSDASDGGTGGMIDG